MRDWWAPESPSALGTGFLFRQKTGTPARTFGCLPPSGNFDSVRVPVPMPGLAVPFVIPISRSLLALPLHSWDGVSNGGQSLAKGTDSPSHGPNSSKSRRRLGDAFHHVYGKRLDLVQKLNMENRVQLVSRSAPGWANG